MGSASTSTCTRAQMAPSLLSWQGRRTPRHPQAAFHMKAQNVPAFLFPKVPPASCVPHTDLVCTLCRSPVLSRRKPSTIHTCASLPYFDLDHTDLSKDPHFSCSLLLFSALDSPPPGCGLLAPNPGRRGFSCFLWFQGRVSQLYCLA